MSFTHRFVNAKIAELNPHSQTTPAQREESLVNFTALIVKRPNDDHPYATNLVVAGLKFEESHADVRFSITPKKLAVKNLDFRIGFDRGMSPPAVIFGMAQRTQLRDVLIIPPEGPRLALGIKGKDGRTETVPVELGVQGPINVVSVFGPVWRVRAGDIFNEMILELVIDVGQSPSPHRKLNWSPAVLEAWGSYDVQFSQGVRNIPFHYRFLLNGTNSASPIAVEGSPSSS